MFTRDNKKHLSIVRRYVSPYIFGLLIVTLGTPIYADSLAATSQQNPISTNEPETIHIYLDADRTGTRASGIAIERGIRVALAEHNNNIAGHAVKLIVKDHRGSSVRSKRHLKTYLNDDNALAVFSGLHSPPLLDNLDFIHKNKILVLDPWAAAAPITRFTSTENWVFRLSVDDSKAGEFIVKQTLTEGFKRPYLLLEDTGWGKSNYKTMTQALKKQDISEVGVKWFNWSLKHTGAKIILRDIHNANADVILLVANAPEGITFTKAMSSLMQENNIDDIPIRSHWGITGGNFPQIIDAKIRNNLDIKFLQTRFSFNSSQATEHSKKVLKLAKKLFPDEVKKASDITAPTGFIHAYDLTKIFINTVKQAKLDESFSTKTQDTREHIRGTLESLNTPVKGLIKTYSRPFSVYSKENPDAHEALGSEDFVMGYYDENGHILITEQ